MNTAFFALNDRFLSMFPPPSFLAAPFSAIYFSSDSLILVEFSVGSRGVYLSRFAEKKLGSGIIERGVVADEDTLSLALRELSKESHIDRVRLVLPDEQIYLFTTGVPMLNKEGTKDNISFQIEENVPLTLEEVFFDYTLIPESSVKGIRAPRRAAVVVMEKKVLEAYLRASDRAGIQALSVEAESQALARSVVSKDSVDSQIMVHIGRECTGIYIVAHGVVQYASCVDMGGVSFDSALKKSFPEATPEALEEMKRAHSFTGAPKEKEFVSALSGGVSALQDEINRRYLYWHTREEVEALTHPPIKSLVISGSSSVLKGLAEHLSLGLGLPVTVADPWVNAPSKEGVPRVTLAEALAAAPAIGGALRGVYSHTYA